MGIQSVEEIQVGYTDQQNLNKWKTFLAPLRQFNRNRWHPGRGPSIHLVQSEIKEINALIFKVPSLQLAAQYLESKSLTGERDADSIKVKLPESWDFTIILRQ